MPDLAHPTWTSLQRNLAEYLSKYYADLQPCIRVVDSVFLELSGDYICEFFSSYPFTVFLNISAIIYAYTLIVFKAIKILQKIRSFII